jgi:pyruvate/2-oxoglutarate dehydrogenase complex dihydrolipoamide acyltransferase (E2) component
MGIFSAIKDAIFGHAAAAAPAAEAAPAPVAPAADAAPAAPAPAAAPAAPVDIEPILDKLADDHGDDLNWRTSIVDLMKLLDLDSSLDHRKQLAEELKYDGDMDDSASMNIWLHKHVMTELAANGGKVPADLTA